MSRWKQNPKQLFDVLLLDVLKYPDLFIVTILHDFCVSWFIEYVTKNLGFLLEVVAWEPA